MQQYKTKDRKNFQDDGKANIRGNSGSWVYQRIPARWRPQMYRWQRSGTSKVTFDKCNVSHLKYVYILPECTSNMLSLSQCSMWFVNWASAAAVTLDINEKLIIKHKWIVSTDLIDLHEEITALIIMIYFFLCYAMFQVDWEPFKNGLCKQSR